MIPRIAQGHVVSCQYWDGTAKLNENPEKSKTTGKWHYGLVPGSDFSGKRVHRSISSPLAALLINKYSPRKAQAAYLALWLGSGKNSVPIVSDPVNTFNDAWAKEHMTAPHGDQGLQRRPASRRSSRTSRWSLRRSISPATWNSRTRSARTCRRPMWASFRPRTC